MAGTSRAGMGLVLVLTAGIAVAVGCGDEESDDMDGQPMAGSGAMFDAGTDPNRNAVTAGMLCDRLSEIQCAGEEHCCDKPGRTRAQCKQMMFDGCSQTLMLDLIAADPVTGFDAAKAKAGFEMFEALAAMCDPGIATWAVSPTGLRAILPGTRAVGTACEPGDISDEAKVAAALASCEAPESTACLAKQEGPFALSWMCSPLSPIGEGCVTDVNCVAGAYCDNPKRQIGTCVARKAVGADCAAPNECTTLFCKQSKCVEVGVQAAYCLAN